MAYASQNLKGVETNYTVMELDCLTIVWALKKWHIILLGRHVKVHTDHRALKFLETCVNNNIRIARCFTFLQSWRSRHMKGSSNEQVDALSRSLTETYEQEGQTKMGIIQDIRDGSNTEKWIPVIRRA